MKIDFITSESGDWIGMYVNDKLVAQGHSLDEYTIVTALGFDYTTEEKSEEWFDEHGNSCPETLN